MMCIRFSRISIRLFVISTLLHFSGQTNGEEIDFEYSCVILDAPSGDDVTTSLPEGISFVRSGDSFVVEFWATDSGDVNTGMVSVYTDMTYSADLLTCNTVEHTNLFGLFRDGVCEAVVVDELGGSQLSGGVGVEPEWVRIAYVEFTADEAGRAEFQLQPAAAESSAFNTGLVQTSDIGYGACSVLIDPCTAFDDVFPPECAIDARQPSNIDGIVRQGWNSIELSVGPSGCFLDSEMMDVDVEPAVEPLGIANVVRVEDFAVIEFDAIIPTRNWTCLSLLLDSSQKACIGFLPCDVNGDRTANPALDLGALIDCINRPGTCRAWQENIDRTGGSAGVLDITRLIDLFNGAGEYDSCTGSQLPACPSE